MFASLASRFLGSLVPSMGSSADLPSTAPWADYWYQSVGLPGLSGMMGGDDAYEFVSPMMSATQFLAGIGSTIPINLTKIESRKSGEKIRNILEEDPRQQLINDEANPDQTAMAARSMGCCWQINKGTAFLEIQREEPSYRGTQGPPVHIWPIYPTRCRPYRKPDGTLMWLVKNINTDDSHVAEANMLRVPSVILGRNGLMGVGVTDRAMQTIQLGQSFDRTENDASMSGVPRIAIEIERPMTIIEQDAMRRQWRELHTQGGDQIAVMAGKSKVVPLSWSATASDFVKRKELHWNTCAMLYEMPPVLLNIIMDPHTDREKALQQFHKCGLKWLTAWVKECNRKLLTIQERRSGMGFTLDFMSLLEADPIGRADIASRLIPIGATNPNEVREREGWNPYIGGDMFYMQGALRPFNEPYNATSPQNPPQDPKTGKKDPLKLPKPAKASIAESSLKMCAKTMLEDTLRRLTHKEAKAACNAAKKPQEWFVWVDAFYADHQTWASAELKLPLQACAAFGVTITSDEMAKNLIDTAKATLITASDGDREMFVDRIEAIAAHWDKNRAVDTINAIAELN